MDALTLANVLDALSKFGAIGTAALMIWALMTERLVPKSRLDELRHERSEGRKAMAEGLREIAKLTRAVERLNERLDRER